LFRAGESLFELENWQQSVDVYLQLMREYPESPKIPSVLYQIGKSYYSLQQFEKSNAVFDYLKTQFPTSHEAINIPNQ
jgi:TolA-binding protein